MSFDEKYVPPKATETVNPTKLPDLQIKEVKPTVLTEKPAKAKDPQPKHTR